MGFSFLGMDGSDDAIVGHFAVAGDFMFWDEKNCSGACFHAVANSLSEAAEFVGEAACPDVFFEALHEVLVFLDFAGDGIGDGVGQMNGLEMVGFCAGDLVGGATCLGGAGIARGSGGKYDRWCRVVWDWVFVEPAPSEIWR
jgi:hypothetical protein